jgi:hypothetical protein
VNTVRKLKRFLLFGDAESAASSPLLSGEPTPEGHGGFSLVCTPAGSNSPVPVTRLTEYNTLLIID